MGNLTSKNSNNNSTITTGDSTATNNNNNNSSSDSRSGGEGRSHELEDDHLPTGHNPLGSSTDSCGSGYSSSGRRSSPNSSMRALMKGRGTELVAFLRANGPKGVYDVLSYLKEQLLSNSIDIGNYIDKINHTFYMSLDHDAARAYLAGLSKPRACHTVWGPSTMFYRCKTCALSPNSSICIECFQKGNHEKEGHDYASSFAFYGGSCDCGSSDSWKLEGACSTHSHSGPEEDPSKNIQDGLLVSTHLVIRAVLVLINEMDQANEHKVRTKFSPSIIESYSLELLTWLDTIARIGTAVSHVLSEELCYQTIDPANLSLSSLTPLKFTTEDEVIMWELPPHQRPPLDSLILIESPELRSKIVYMVLFLLCEYSFKFGFSQSYSRVYPKLAKLKSIDTIFRYSPQVFSVSSIALCFSKSHEPSFLDTILSTTIDILGKDQLDKHHIAIISDIKTIIQIPGISIFMLFERRSLLAKYLHILRIIQGIDPIQRIKTNHIEYDHDDWLYAFQVDSELRDISKEIIDSISKDCKTLENVSGDFESTYMGVKVSPHDIFEGNKSVSLILPLYRFFGTLIERTIYLYPQGLNVKDLIPEHINLYKFISPFLLVQCFIHQVNNSYWVRNNDTTVRRKAYLYCLFFLENDLSIIQLVDPNQFLIFSSKEFNATIPATIKSLLNTNNHRYHQYLKFVIQVIQERYMTNDKSFYVQNSLIHLLCAHPKTHSKVATEQPASGDHPATYKMRPEFWKLFNPYYPLFTPLNTEDSVMAFLEWKKNSKALYPESSPSPPPLPPLHESRQHISDLLHSDYLHYIILQLLASFEDPEPAKSTSPSHSDITEVMYGINECLYLIILAIENRKPIDSFAWDSLAVSATDPLQVGHNNSILAILQQYQLDGRELPTSTLELLIGLLKRSKEQNIYNDKKEMIVRAVEELYQIHPEIQTRILELYPSYSLPRVVDDAKSSEDKIKCSKQRQAEIMARFTQQQNKFLQNIEADDDESTDNEATCVLCFKGQYSRKDPLSMIAMYQYSTLLTYTKILELPNLNASLKKHCSKNYLKYLTFPVQKSTPEILNYTSSLHLRCCGHHIHNDCFDKYIQVLLNKASHRDNFEGDNIIRPLSGDIDKVSKDSVEEYKKNQLKVWFTALTQRPKVAPKRREDSTYLHFFHSLNKVAFKGGNVESISPYFLCQLVTRNIDIPIFAIGNDIFARDVLTIKTLYRNFKDYILQHNETKYRDSTIEMFKGKSDSILSIDPFGSFVLFLSVIDNPSKSDIEKITSLSLDIFVVQFIVTKILSSTEKKKKISLVQMAKEFLEKSLSPELMDELMMDISPFLRCLCLTHHCLLRHSMTQLTKEELIVKDRIFGVLDISSLQTLVLRQLSNPLMSPWIIQLERNLNSAYFIMEPRRPRFVDLPTNFHEFFIKYLNVPCNTCKKVPAKSAVCLLCGHLICINGQCCVINNVRESTKHVHVCGLFKVGVFLETKNPTITLIRDHRKSAMNNAFLDNYGESDPNLERGKPLIRSDNNLQDLWCSWISHCIEEKYLQNCNLQGRDY
eukprot:gene6264-7269_t